MFTVCVRGVDSVGNIGLADKTVVEGRLTPDLESATVTFLSTPALEAAVDITCYGTCSYKVYGLADAGDDCPVDDSSYEATTYPEGTSVLVESGTINTTNAAVCILPIDSLSRFGDPVKETVN